MAADAPSGAEAHKLEGNRLLRAGQLQEAIAAYSRAIEEDAAVAAFWGNRCQARRQAGDHAGALSDADAALRLEPKWGKAHYRRAMCLQALGRPAEGTQACLQGLKYKNGEGEIKEFKALQEKLGISSAEEVIAGPWHGKVSKELGSYEQEFEFAPDGVFKCVVENSPLPGKYKLSKVESDQNGQLRGTLSVTVEGNPDATPYLFRVDPSDRRALHLCCPMVRTNDPPRTFDGPGYVAMHRGSKAAGGVEDLSEGTQVLRYLEDLTKVLEEQHASGGAGGAVAAERLTEHDPGSTVGASELVGEETLEDKGRKMAHENRMQAFRLKYSEDVGTAAQGLIKGDVQATAAYPEQAQDLARMLRRLKGTGVAVKQEEKKPAAITAAGESPPNGTMPKVEVVPAAAPAPAPGAAAAPKAATTATAAQGNSCCGGCFAGLGR